MSLVISHHVIVFVSCDCEMPPVAIPAVCEETDYSVLIEMTDQSLEHIYSSVGESHMCPCPILRGILSLMKPFQ